MRRPLLSFNVWLLLRDKLEWSFFYLVDLASEHVICMHRITSRHNIYYRIIRTNIIENVTLGCYMVLGHSAIFRARAESETAPVRHRHFWCTRTRLWILAGTLSYLYHPLSSISLLLIYLIEIYGIFTHIWCDNFPLIWRYISLFNFFFFRAMMEIFVNLQFSVTRTWKCSPAHTHVLIASICPYTKARLETHALLWDMTYQ